MNPNDPKSDRLETFLRRWLSQNPRWQYASPGWPADRRSPEELASALLADAEFAEVGLADWLNSPDGQLIETAVGRVLPMPQAIEFQVLVDALTLAAQAQQRGQ